MASSTWGSLQVAVEVEIIILAHAKKSQVQVQVLGAILEVMFDFGVYHFTRHRVGYRADFCLRCESECIAEQWKSFDALYYFYIPFLPLGLRRRWHCPRCGQNPHTRARTGRFYLWAGLILCVLLAFVMWTVPLQSEDMSGVWIMRVLLPLGALALAFSLRSRPQAPILKERLARVRPLEGDTCLFCHSRLIEGEVPKCSACGLERHRVS